MATPKISKLVVKQSFELRCPDPPGQARGTEGWLVLSGWGRRRVGRETPRSAELGCWLAYQCGGECLPGDWAGALGVHSILAPGGTLWRMFSSGHSILWACRVASAMPTPRSRVK